MQARGEPHAFQRLFALEPLADLAQHGHGRFRPLDALLAAFGEREVFDIVIHRGSVSIEICIPGEIVFDL